MANKRPGEAEIIGAIAAHLGEALPAGWTLQRNLNNARQANADATLTLKTPHSTTSLQIGFHHTITPRDVALIANRLTPPHANEVPVVASSYLSKPARLELQKAGISYIDATGNTWVYSSSPPGLLLSLSGSDNDPWREPGRPLAGLTGRPAAAVVRTLADTGTATSATTLAADAGVAIGSAYRVLGVLEERGLIERTPSAVRVPKRFALLDAWCEEYSFLSTNRVQRFVAKRGIPAFLKQIADDNNPLLTVTGALALPEAARAAAATTVMAYTDEFLTPAGRYGLIPSDRGANVVLAVPAYPVLTQGASRVDGLPATALSQAYADLLTSGGRGPSEAEHLRDWLERTGG